MPCMDRQSVDRLEHTAFDGSINVADSPCNNYVAQVSHLASLGFGTSPSSKTFFDYLLCALLLTMHNNICMWRAFFHKEAIYVDRKLGKQQQMDRDRIGQNNNRDELHVVGDQWCPRWPVL